jgi:hypothetical protein
MLVPHQAIMVKNPRRALEPKPVRRVIGTVREESLASSAKGYLIL